MTSDCTLNKVAGDLKIINTVDLYSIYVYIDCMNTNTHTEQASYSLNELCVLADINLRTARYYVQIGLVDKPVGETRAARYGVGHLEQLLQIKKWADVGLSLERIRELLHGEAPMVATRQRVPGTVEVCSHLLVADGVELVIEPNRAGLSPEQFRQFVKGVMVLYGQIADQKTQQSEAGDDDGQS